jgi:putative hydrolase of the HAD superfamily
MMARMPGTIWWDFDGTLVSRPKMWSGAGHRLLTKTYPSHRISLQDFAKQFHTGLPWHRQDNAHPELATPELWWDDVYRVYANVFRDFGFDGTKLLDALPEIRADILDATRYRLFDDAVPVLMKLAGNGWRQIVVSNHVSELADIIAGCGIGSFFDAVITSGLVGYEKPHTQMFEAAMTHSVPNASIWMIGDNVTCDCVPVRALGRNAVLVRTESADYDCCARDLWAASAIIESNDHDAEMTSPIESRP